MTSAVVAVDTVVDAVVVVVACLLVVALLSCLETLVVAVSLQSLPP